MAQQPINTGREGDLLLCFGEESDFYQGEIVDIALESLEKSLDETETGSRRKAVLQSVIESNPKVGRREEIIKELKKIFKDYKSPTPAIRSELKKIGFSITESGKHHRIHHSDCEEYFCTLPSTGSDRRGGRNCASDTIKKLL